MRLAATLLAMAALTGCTDDGAELLFDLHVAHDFEEAPRTHGFATGDDADRLVLHLQLAPKDNATCDPEHAPSVRIALRNATNETIAQTDRVDRTCRTFEEFRIPLAQRGLWVIEFDGRGAFLGSADVTAEASGTSFRVAR